MSSDTPGTKIDTTSRFSSKLAITAMILVVVVAAVILGLAIHAQRLNAAYEDAFTSGGVDAVVTHAQDRGDDVEQFTGGAYANGGQCYLSDGNEVEDLTLAQCQEEAAIAAGS